MLRISRVEDGASVRFKLEGKLLEPWIAELATLCSQAGGGRRVLLDLASVSFVDAAGARLLTSLLDDGAQVVAASSFVAELLFTERS